MSIVSNSPRTLHQVAQLKAKLAREAAANKASKVAPINRVFGEGVFNPISTPPAKRGVWTPKPLPGFTTRDGRYIPTAEESRQWAELSAKLEIEPEQREEEDRLEAMTEEANWDDYFRDMEEMEAASYGINVD